MAFNFTAEWCKGTTNQAPDALSRNSIWAPQSAEMLAEQDKDNKPELSISEIRNIHNIEGQESIRMQKQTGRKGPRIPMTQGNYSEWIPR